MPFYRYSRWDGTQQVFAIHEDELMEQLAEQMVNHGDVSRSLRSLAQQGLRGRFGRDVPGIEQLLERLRDMRRDVLDKYNVEGVLDDIVRRIQDIVDMEREGIARRLAGARDRLSTPSEERAGDAGPSPTPEERERLLRRLERDGLPEPGDPWTACRVRPPSPSRPSRNTSSWTTRPGPSSTTS